MANEIWKMKGTCCICTYNWNSLWTLEKWCLVYHIWNYAKAKGDWKQQAFLIFYESYV